MKTKTNVKITKIFLIELQRLIVVKVELTFLNKVTINSYF